MLHKLKVNTQLYFTIVRNKSKCSVSVTLFYNLSLMQYLRRYTKYYTTWIPARKGSLDAHNDLVVQCRMKCDRRYTNPFAFLNAALPRVNLNLACIIRLLTTSALIPMQLASSDTPP